MVSWTTLWPRFWTATRDRLGTRRELRTSCVAGPRRDCRAVRPICEVLEDRDLLAITLRFDYTFDTVNFFNTQQKKDLLETAGAMLSQRLNDSLSAIVPSGGDTWNATITNPATGSSISLGNLTIPANTIVVYVGGRDLPGAVGLGGPGGGSAVGNQAWLDTVFGRGQAGALLPSGSQTDFGPAVASIAFDTVGTTFFFGATTDGITSTQTDFLSTAVHELGHVLGIGTAGSWDRLVSGTVFVGANSSASFGGAVPVESGGGHWAQSVTSDGQEAAMVPSSLDGTRHLFTSLDFAGLRDVGWQLSSTTPTAGITITPTSGLVTTEAGGKATFTVALSSTPTANVTIGLSSSNTAEGTVSPTSLTFTPSNALTPQTVTVTGVDDSTVDGNVAYTIVTAAGVSTDPSYSGLNGSDVSVTNNDNDKTATPGITVAPTSGLVTTQTGGTATFTVVLDSTPTASVTIGLSSSNTKAGTVAPTSLTFTTTNALTPQTVTVTGVDDPTTTSPVNYTIVTAAAVSKDSNYNGRDPSDVSVTNNDTTSGKAIVVTTPDAGGGPIVMVSNALTGESQLAFLAYEAGFAGGVRVALGDITGDGTPDIITAPGPGGGPLIRVFDGNTGTALSSAVGAFFAFDPRFAGGVNLAAADMNGDGIADIIAAPDAGGGPLVQVFSGKDGSLLNGFFAYDPRFTGGVRLAAGDVNGDGVPDIITAPGAGGGPHVRVFSGTDNSELLSFFAYNTGFGGGVFVAAGDVNGDGRADIITGPGTGGTPDVRVISGADGTLMIEFQPYPAGFLGGVRVAARDVNNDGLADIITGAGPGGGPQVRVFDALTLADLDTFFALDPRFTAGIFVA